MTSFDETIEINGIAPDTKFNLIRRTKGWELTVTGVKDVETGEEETKIFNISNLEAACTMALFIDFEQLPELKEWINKVLTLLKTYDGIPEHLKIIPTLP